MNDKKRIVINKPAGKTCDICKGIFSLYSFSSHIKHLHKMTSDEYAIKYGEFRKPKRNPSTRNIQQIICQICNTTIPSVGMFTHLRDTHNVTTDDYTKQYGEYRPSKLRQLEYVERLKHTNEEDRETCVICNAEFASCNLLGYHIKNEHKLKKKNYIFNHIFKGIRPLCMCGCQGKVKLLSYYPYKVDYISGHNSDGESNSMYGKKHTTDSKKKMSISAINRINSGIGKTIDTEPELRFKAILDKFEIKYEHPFTVNLGTRSASVDFYLPEMDLLVEIDGEYWHPDKIEGLNFHILPNVISDKQREILSNMVRIRPLNLEKYEELNTRDKIYELLLNSISNTNIKPITYYQKIIKKEYFKICHDEKRNNYVKSNIWLLLKFIRTFQEKFPYPDLEENISEVINKISKLDMNRIYNSETKEFSNNISTVGHNYLKHYFKSYWKSKFNGNKSPEEAWGDDKIMSDVIEYRIGCNDSGEVFDFSLHQLVRGLSARRIGVSFFSPLLASAIYKTILKDNKSPIVLDPCCGFGGRLLGFKSAYPDGTYIGCEPNIETYNELINMIDREKFKNVKIYNCKFENYSDTKDVNLTFTSIPYYDIEIYSNNTEYKSFDDWKSVFIQSIESCNNCYINVPQKLATRLSWTEKLEFKIKKNICHFNKNKKDKTEFIVKL